MPHAEFDIFLSHNSTDKPEVVKLATKLKELGLNPWLDAWHLKAGEKWLPAIERALASSDSCAVIVGPNGLGNVHEDEMWVALQQGLESKGSKRGFPVIPVLLPNSTRGDRTRLPKFLTANTWVEFARSIDDPAALDKLAKAIRGEAPGAGVKLPAGECPYRGLAYFDIQHAPLFFGREALTDWLLSRLRGTATKEGPTRFLAIVGASGSGKSSLARAGVLAKLKQGELPGSARWPLVICRPESRPLESLATALANTEGVNLGTGLISKLIESLRDELAKSPGQLHLVAQAAMPANDRDWRLVVFVDQFEELFTLNVADRRDSQPNSPPPALSADRVAFFRNLLHAASIESGRTIVILTMRADFYGKCAAIPELADAVSAYQQLVGPMSADELRRAIETPAQLSSGDIEPGLIDMLVREVADQPGALPLLQYALAELWSKSRDLGLNTLTTAAYRELGGWEGALSRRADAVLAEFKNTPQEKLCRELFLRLVQPGEGTEDTKRLVRWQELRRGSVEDAAALEQTVRKLADNRLITTSGDSTAGDELHADSTVEVVHEALIRGWGELRKWLDADRAGLRIHRQLTESANEWAKSHADLSRRDPSLLYTGTRLAVARELAKRGDVAFNDIESRFLNASTQAVRARTRRTVLTWAGTAAAVVLLALAGTLIARNNQNETRAREMVENLKNAKESQVPEIVKALGGYRRWADEPLRQLFAGAADDSSAKLHAALALASVDAAVIGHLRDRLLTATPAQFLIVRDSLEQNDPQHPQQIEGLWKTAQDVTIPIARRFQAACALATYAPEDHRWHGFSAAVIDHLLTLEASDLVAWRTALRPAGKQLLEPLAAIYRSTAAREQARTYAAETLADYATDDFETLFDLLADAEQFQFPKIYNKLTVHRERFVALGQAELEKQADEDAGEEAREALGRRQANVAVALLKLGAAQHVWKVLKHSPDPRARSNMIDWLSPLGVDPQMLIRRFDEEEDVTIRRALLLALGEFTEAQFPPADRAPLIDKLLALYESDPDRGLHAAAEWLLRQWGQAEEVEAVVNKLRGNEPQLRSRQPTDQRQWYVNSQAQTFVILEAGEFQMGSAISEPDHQNNEARHLRRLGRTLAIAAKEVTKKEYRQFLEANPKVQKFDVDQYSRTDDSPQVAVDWYDAARYCNWLSQSEGLPEDQWCYDPNKEFAEGMQPVPDFLQRTGYRLPTEAEWEFACRAEALTSRFYGASVALLPKYAWFIENSLGNHPRPTGLLKPNDFGLFDGLGNVMEWCHDSYGSRYPVTDTREAVNDTGDNKPVEEKYGRVLRGASFYSLSSFVRSCYRYDGRPGYLNLGFGVRPARTYR
ncbi:MAG: TIR domain-containing protein [Planctomycetaceae bacterium]|nr:TIR domain-containing protein [Planctomycetaceae bacterium]